MATISYTPKGVCSRKIDIEVEDGIVKKVHFTGGCNGNTQLPWKYFQKKDSWR